MAGSIFLADLQGNAIFVAAALLGAHPSISHQYHEGRGHEY